jgi:hypothetical protein
MTTGSYRNWKHSYRRRFKQTKCNPSRFILLLLCQWQKLKSTRLHGVTFHKTVFSHNLLFVRCIIPQSNAGNADFISNSGCFECLVYYIFHFLTELTFPAIRNKYQNICTVIPWLYVVGCFEAGDVSRDDVNRDWFSHKSNVIMGKVFPEVIKDGTEL